MVTSLQARAPAAASLRGKTGFDFWYGGDMDKVRLEVLDGGNNKLKIGSDAERRIRETLDAQSRAQKAMDLVKASCEKWGCMINPIIAVSGMGVRPDFELMPKQGMIVGNDGVRVQNCFIEIQKGLEDLRCGIVPKLTWMIVPLTAVGPVTEKASV